MAKVIVFGNRKGGVGKSTLTMMTATALSQAPFNKKILVIDADDQQSLVKFRNDDLGDDLDAEPSYKIISCLNDIDRLYEIIQRARTTHDYIFVDVAGRLDDFTKKVLFYVDVLMVPFQAGNFSLESTFDYVKFALKVSQKREGNKIRPITMVGFVNMYIKGRTRYRDAREDLEAFEKYVSVLDNNLGFYTAFMDADTLNSIYSKKSSDTAKRNFRCWLNELIKTAGL
ncbi:ParA family protein [Aureispira anguillae]|uniref:ParA family protein n=1 Tax=Aureispira anguillae TaxID=2864201 RepID=A0A916DXA2_9BACT|nr:ParA family protein [Aureispira anguillae]BDS15657.1 ParA family protein [Aureispira anguillae]